MDGSVMDREPNESGSIGDELCAYAYATLIKAIIEDNVADMNWAAHIVRQTDHPLAKSVSKTTKSLEGVILDQDHETLALQRETAFAAALRSYVYSGLDVNTDVILSCSRKLGLSSRQLRRIISPSNDLMIHLDLGEASSEDNKIVRNLGHQTALYLGVGTPIMRLAQVFTLRA